MSEELHRRVHPDADALNAFIEGALPEHERVECLAHLAGCSRCRDVVFLAQKAAEIAEPAAAPGAPVSSWQRFLRPAAAMSVAVTAIIALFSFGLYRMVRSAEPQPRLTASTKAPAKVLPAKPSPIDTAPPAQAEKQTPESQPAPRTVSPQPVPAQREQPPATSSPSAAPAAAAPPVVAGASPPSPPPAQVAAAAKVLEGASVVGTITDPAGAVISSARIELKNEETGAAYASASDVNGQYTIAGLAPGRYDLSVTSPGFKSFVRTGVNVQPRETARLDSALALGTATETVTVSAEAAPLLRTETAGVPPQAASRNALPLSTGALDSLSAVAGPSPAYTLPDKSPPVSVATKDKLVVAVDSAGGLLISENAGKTWSRVKAAWKGKVVRVSVSANAMFELTTDPASRWVSSDGRHWSEAHTSR